MTKQVQCKRCFHLNNDWCIPKMDSPDPDIVRDCQYYIAKTNGDNFRAMTDEELATKFYLLICVHVFDSEVKCKDNGCKKCWLDWLKECAE